jgi:hypothetical protein
LDIIKKSAEAEKYELEEEISRLEEELSDLISKIDCCPSCGYNLADYLSSIQSGGGDESKALQSVVMVTQPLSGGAGRSAAPSMITPAPSAVSSGWSAFNIFGYFFSSSTSTSIAVVEKNTVIQRV